MRYHGSISSEKFIRVMTKQSLYSQDTRSYNIVGSAYARLWRGMGFDQKRVNVW